MLCWQCCQCGNTPGETGEGFSSCDVSVASSPNLQKTIRIEKEVELPGTNLVRLHREILSVNEGNTLAEVVDLLQDFFDLPGSTRFRVRDRVGRTVFMSDCPDTFTFKGLSHGAVYTLSPTLPPA
ncbi:hypothetical protein DIPPA_10108 [Diplonema papillatum]|nr:hypothetical protein DIPPA_10108 [Diplonema papillatum]